MKELTFPENDAAGIAMVPVSTNVLASSHLLPLVPLDQKGSVGL